MEGRGVDLPSCAVPSQRGKPGADLPVWYPFHHSAPTMQILAREKKEEENERIYFLFGERFLKGCTGS